MAAAVAHDPADLLALDVAVDAGHPRVDLGEQQALARCNDVVGPGIGTRRGGLDAGQAAVAREADQPGHPIGAVFGGAREVAEPGMRAVRPENLKLFIDLTFFACLLMLDQRTLPSADTPW